MPEDICKSSSISTSSGRALFFTFILWLISKKSRHGYEVIKILKTETGFDKIGSGHIYPILSKLLEMGLISQKIETDGERSKKSYAITNSGRKYLLFLKKSIFQKGLRKTFFLEMIK